MRATTFPTRLVFGLLLVQTAIYAAILTVGAVDREPASSRGAEEDGGLDEALDERRDGPRTAASQLDLSDRRDFSEPTGSIHFIDRVS